MTQPALSSTVLRLSLRDAVWQSLPLPPGAARCYHPMPGLCKCPVVFSIVNKNGATLVKLRKKRERETERNGETERKRKEEKRKIERQKEQKKEAYDKIFLHVCLITRTIHKDSARTTALHRGYHNLTQKIFPQRCQSNNCSALDWCHPYY